MPKPVLGPKRRTNPLIWLAAIICAILAVAVIITGMVVFIGYLVMRPKVPLISLSYAHLDQFDYDQAGHLTTKLTLLMRAENDNAKVDASFYNQRFTLSFHGQELNRLGAFPYDVARNSSLELKYVAEAPQVPLDPLEQEIVQLSFRRDLVTFELKGDARTRWRIGLLGSVKFWLHLNCQLRFFINGTSLADTRCTTRSK